ncbi:FHA domain-containing protein [Microtetraspora malaysiensis]|uniref:FHA domain-containing protein n=1 Tax=Microtetraspora malaysiensis TaxID=161358 RepID=A0ABW6T052_9ACTN
MAICPVGHDSADEEYCDVCGALLAGTPAVPAAPVASAPAVPPDAHQLDDCPDCGAPRGGRFCESCGYDFVLGGGNQVTPPSTPPSPQPSMPDTPASGWVAVIAADRDHYEAVIAQGGPDAARVAFPPYCPERRVPLAGLEVRIGRRSKSRALTPEIDLAGPPEDPGVSHLHAVLLAQPDGTWQLVDLGSANGTLLNGKTVEHNALIPLGDGDRVHVGAWTSITVRKG